MQVGVEKGWGGVGGIYASPAPSTRVLAQGERRGADTRKFLGKLQRKKAGESMDIGGQFVAE